MEVRCVNPECQEMIEIADLVRRAGLQEPVEMTLMEVACSHCGTPNRIPWAKGEAAFVLLQ